MTLTGRAAIERALTAVGERLAHAGAPCSIVVLGGAAINLLGLVDRPTRDVDVLATAASPGGPIGRPDPLPRPLLEAVDAVARDLDLRSDWLNTTVADQWRFGLPPGLAGRVHWRTDQTGPESIHFQDLLALCPTDDELARAAEWVKRQDVSADFHSVVAEVDHARRSVR